MSTMTRRAFLGMAGVAGAGLWLGLPGTARADVTRETRVMLGTFVDVSLSGTSSMQASEALERAFAEAARLEKVFSRYDGGTPVSELNRAGTLRDCPPELTRLVNRSLFYGAVTGGGFDITVQPVPAAILRAVCALTRRSCAPRGSWWATRGCVWRRGGFLWSAPAWA